jgi:two-component system sensor histidine kinase PilS (NtrC family)
VATPSYGVSPVPVRVSAGRSTGWLILFRLILFCLVVGASLHGDAPSGLGQTLLWLYFAVTLVFLFFYSRKRRAVWILASRYSGALLLLLEVAVEASMVAETNALASPFALLFLLTIVSASLQFRLVGTLLVATATSVAVTIAVFVGIAGPEPGVQAAKDFSTVLNLNDDLFYALFLYVCAFYMAAFVSGYLAEKLELQDRALEGASRALEQARLETDDILRHMQSGLLTLNAQGTVVFFNRTAEDILDLTEDQVTGFRCRESFGEGMDQLVHLLESALQGRGGGIRTEVRVVRSDGRSLPLGISTSLLGKAGEDVRGVIAIFQDLTEAKRLEERMRVADRMAAVGELSASIAHELRNPLATVTGSVEMLRQIAAQDDDTRSLLDMILKESARLNRIVTDFLDFARIKQQQCQEVDLSRVGRDVISLFEHHPARKPGCQIHFLCEPDVATVAADPAQVQQMLVNLVQNALEALESDQGQVAIDIKPVPLAHAEAKHHVDVTVSDNGPGIPEMAKERIGQPFFSTKKKGTGLGLAIVQRLAIAAGGSLRWRNRGEGGAAFTIRLPVYSKEYFDAEVAHLSTAAGRPLG